MCRLSRHTSCKHVKRQPTESTVRNLASLFALSLVVAASVAANEPASPGLPYKVTASDGLFLDDVQRRAVLFFEEQTDEGTGLTLDRAPVEGTPRRSTSSVAATGFGLTAWCIADARGWFPAGEAKRRTRETLRYVL